MRRVILLIALLVTTPSMAWSWNHEPTRKSTPPIKIWQAAANNTYGPTLILAGFPPDTARAASFKIFQKYDGEIAKYADQLKSDTSLQGLIYGFADNLRYAKHHEANNAAIALARAEAFQDYLGAQHGIPKERLRTAIAIVEDSVGPAFRKVTFQLQSKPKVVQVQALPKDTTIAFRIITDAAHPKKCCAGSSQDLALSLGLGGASTAFDAVPYVQAALTWKQRFALDFQGGVSPWTSDQSFDRTRFSTRSRFIGVHGTYYLKPNGVIGLTGGYERHERLNTDVGEYLQRHEGIVLGLRGRTALSRLFDLTGEAFWLSGERYTYPIQRVSWPTDTFRIGAGITLNLGGRI